MKTETKTRKFGYALNIKRDHKWVRVGFLFNNGREAFDYLQSYYPKEETWSINAVRVNVQPVGYEK